MSKSIQKLLSEEEKVEQQLKELRKKIRTKKKEEEKKLALKLGKISADSACCYIYHQPKMPDALKKMKRF